jgi:SpoVK/Ycf46/Vps4 family AAA+-type ATPase
VVSKYIGETEKNLQRVITAADRSGGVLFFDEADALFGRRTEIHDAHDRYANLELSFLLQRLEDYEGVAILASNLAQNIDDAFVRRIAITIEFPFPDASARAAIWRRHIPAATPLDGDIDFDRLGAAFKVTGGVIRKIAWNAAFLAADDGDRLALHHIARAARREYARMGKPFPADEEGP